MRTMTSFTPQLAGAVLAAAALISPALASAQSAPPYAYANGQDQQIQGTIASIDGTWNITVTDGNGYDDSIALHQGTVINPTGLTLEPGMQVTIDGYPDGSNFDADEIDTPYGYSGPAPVAVYYGPGDWYPGYAYGWGPSFSLVFDLSGRRWEERSFAYAGRVRRAEAPPSGWQNQPHGYIGARRQPLQVAAPTRTSYTAPTRTWSAPQQSRSYAPPQQPTRAYAPPQQPSRTYAPPPQPQRTYEAPAQQRAYAPPQQTRLYAPPAAPVQQMRAYAPPQQPTRTYAAPPQQMRSVAAPAATRSAPQAAPRERQSGDDRRH